MDHQLYLGIDVGKTEYHATGITAAGTVVHDNPLPQSDPKIRAMLEGLQAEHGPVLVVVDQPKTIGALVIAVAQDLGIDVAYLPGLTMRRVADLHPVKRRPMPGTRSSSPTPPGLCLTPCGGSP